MKAKRVKVIVSSQRKLRSAPVLVPQDGSVEVLWLRWPAATTDTETRMGFRAGGRPQIRRFRGSGGSGFPWSVDGGHGPFDRFYPPIPEHPAVECQYTRQRYWYLRSIGSHGAHDLTALLTSLARDAAHGVTA